MLGSNHDAVLPGSAFVAWSQTPMTAIQKVPAYGFAHGFAAVRVHTTLRIHDVPAPRNSLLYFLGAFNRTDILSFMALEGITYVPTW